MAVFKQGPRPEEDFTMISNALARNPEITIEAKGIYMFMRSHRDGWNMTVVRIAEALGASKGRVSKYINELIDAGYIIRSQGSGEGGRFGEIEYLILTSPRPKNPDTVKPDTEKPDTENRPTKEDYSSKKTIPKEDQSPLAPQGEEDGVLAEFEQWYSLYPRKQSRGAAERAFKKARKGTDLPTLIAGLKASIAQWNAERRTRDKIPYPATWLNGKSWLDEVPGGTSARSTPRNSRDWSGYELDFSDWEGGDSNERPF